jgi:hypothetical protein
MRHHGIRAIMAQPRRVRTTDSRHDFPIAPNLLRTEAKRDIFAYIEGFYNRPKRSGFPWCLSARSWAIPPAVRSHRSNRLAFPCLVALLG